MRATIRQIALLYSCQYILGWSTTRKTKIIILNYNFNLKNRYNFVIYFTSNSSQTVFYLCKEPHLRSYRVSSNGFNSFSQWSDLDLVRFSFRFIVSLINLCFFGIKKSNVAQVALLGVIFRFLRVRIKNKNFLGYCTSFDKYLLSVTKKLLTFSWNC